MIWNKYGIAVSCYILLASSCMFLVISGAGFNYFDDDLVINLPNMYIKVMFGIGLGIGFIVFIGLWIFFIKPRFAYNFIVTYPAFAFTLIAYIMFTYPGQTQKYLDEWSNKWGNDLKSESLQFKQQCCGWYNFSDRAIEPCPFNFASGCAEIVSNYLQPRLDEVFYGSLVTFGVAIAGSIPLFAFFITHDENILDQFDNATQ